MEPADNKSTTEKCQKSFYKQPISCPWSTVQPYPSSTNKQEPAGKSTEKSCPSIQQSSSQFFYFLRLMQLFPETHPATLHTVLCLCNNNFFYAVDKLLYARKCKALYNQNQRSYRRCPYERSQPHCSHGDSCKSKRDKVLDLKVHQVSTRTSTDVGTSGRSSSINSGTCSTSEQVPRTSTSSSDRESAQFLIGDSLEGKLVPGSEGSIENYSLHNQSIIQDSDIIII